MLKGMEWEMKYSVNEVVDYLHDVFGIEESEIYDGINKACEHGLNKNDELFDSLMEYSTYFIKSKLSFNEMIEVMITKEVGN